VGGDFSRAQPARGPFGAVVLVVPASPESRPFTAELLVARPEGVLVLRRREAVLAPWGSLAGLEFPGVPRMPDVDGEAPTPEEVSRMAAVGRYAFGLSEAQLAALLAHLGQERVTRLEGRSRRPMR
jgi:hypothetical protein